MPEGTHEAKKPAADVDTLVAGSSPDAAVLAGRSPLPSQLAGPSSSAYVNSGAACEANPELAENRADCFLDPGVRSRLITGFQLRVLEASVRFGEACQALDLDKRLGKKKADMPWYVGLMLDVIGAFAGNTLGKALSQMRSGGLDQLAKVGSELLVQKPDQPNWATISFNALSAVSTKQLGDNIKHVISAVKKEGVSAATSTESPLLSRRHENTETRSFLSTLRAQAGASFARIREDAPAVASDAELLTLFEAFSAWRHTADAYKAAISEKLDRLKASGVSKIGLNLMDPRDPGDRHLDPADARLREPLSPENVRNGPPVGGAREKKVVWVVYGSGAPGHYGYAHRDWGPSTVITAPIERSLHPDDTTTQVPYYAGPVPDEFVEIALLRHREVWGAEPERFVIFEHQFPFSYLADPERIVRSRREYETRLAGVKRMLGGGGANIDGR